MRRWRNPLALISWKHRPARSWEIKILCTCADRLMQKTVFRGISDGKRVLKSGEWAEDFMKLLCTKRRVYMETAMFAKGAAYCAQDHLRPQTSYPYAMICEGRLKSSVAMEVLHKGTGSEL